MERKNSIGESVDLGQLSQLLEGQGVRVGRERSSQLELVTVVGRDILVVVVLSRKKKALCRWSQNLVVAENLTPESPAWLESPVPEGLIPTSIGDR